MILVIQENNLLDKFSLCYPPDEFYFINVFTLLGLTYRNCNFIFMNKNSSKTQAQEFKIQDIDILKIKSMDFLFLRKIKNISLYNKKSLHLVYD